MTAVDLGRSGAIREDLGCVAPILMARGVARRGLLVVVVDATSRRGPGLALFGVLGVLGRCLRGVLKVFSMVLLCWTSQFGTDLARFCDVLSPSVTPCYPPRCFTRCPRSSTIIAIAACGRVRSRKRENGAKPLSKPIKNIRKYVGTRQNTFQYLETPLKHLPTPSKR